MCCHALSPWQGLTSPANAATSPNDVALLSYAGGPLGVSLHANLGDDPRHRTGSAVLALYMELRLVPTAGIALQDAARYALAYPAPPEGCTDNEMLQEWRQISSRLQFRVIALAQVLKWALHAVEQTLCVPGRPSKARQHALLLLQQLSQNGIWLSLAEACVRLCHRLLPEQPGSGVSTPSSAQPQHIVQQWAQLLEEAARSGAGSAEVLRALRVGGSGQGGHAGPAAAAATAAERDTMESGVNVLKSAAMLVWDALYCAVQVLGSSDTASHTASVGLLRSFCEARVVDTLSACLLRLDPARPPCLAGNNPGDSFLHPIMAATRSVMGCIRTAAVPTLYFQPPTSAPPGSLELRMQLVAQPHVLQLMHAAIESFLQEPPPFAAVGFGGSGKPAGSSAISAGATTTAAAPADRKPAWEAFLASASPSDTLSNKMLQRAWPLLAACPFVRHMFGDGVGLVADALDAPEMKQLKIAHAFVDSVLLWALPFAVPGPQHSAIKAALPGLSGFCRIASRLARWCAFATAMVASAAASGKAISVAAAGIACTSATLVSCLKGWPKVRTAAGLGQGLSAHMQCARRATCQCRAAVWCVWWWWWWWGWGGAHAAAAAACAPQHEPGSELHKYPNERQEGCAR